MLPKRKNFAGKYSHCTCWALLQETPFTYVYILYIIISYDPTISFLFPSKTFSCYNKIVYVLCWYFSSLTITMVRGFWAISSTVSLQHCGNLCQIRFSCTEYLPLNLLVVFSNLWTRRHFNSPFTLIKRLSSIKVSTEESS